MLTKLELKLKFKLTRKIDSCAPKSEGKKSYFRLSFEVVVSVFSAANAALVVV